MHTVETVADLRRRVATLRDRGARIGLVPTMGALHAGHLALVRCAVETTDQVIVSAFVNPLQFAPREDYERYPRTLAADRAALETLDGGPPDLLYVPSVTQMYPNRRPEERVSIATTVHVAGLAGRLEGASRPGHFDGVCTVVIKLLHQAEPHAAFFGRKDYQQLLVIRRMVADLDMPVEIVGVPTVREPDGLAMSSRNAYLDRESRLAARCLSRGLAAAVMAARQVGPNVPRPSAGMLRDAVLGTISAEPRARVDYVAVVDPDTLEPPDEAPRGEGESRPTRARGSEAHVLGRPTTAPDPAARHDPLLVAVAVHVGPARLIDNVVVGDQADEDRLLAAVV
ncbi:MAG TPA: pantoate--beta-alanine ligase [Nitriliruptorales bacterium]|nr:pantoate--beta-alanine ligase [Nitriliruptorales bacterium]